MPGIAVGTKLAGVAAIWGAVWITWRFFASAWVMRADVMGPRPKRFSSTITTPFFTLLLR
jgi:hypothetical protein